MMSGAMGGAGTKKAAAPAASEQGGVDPVTFQPLPPSHGSVSGVSVDAFGPTFGTLQYNKEKPSESILQVNSAVTPKWRTLNEEAANKKVPVPHVVHEVVVEEMLVESQTKRTWLSDKKHEQALNAERMQGKQALVDSNAQGIKDQIASTLAKKKALEPVEEPKGPAAAQLSARQMIEAERAAAKELVAEKAAALKAAKADKKRLEKEAEAEAIAKQEQADAEAEFLASMPEWKRGKLLRERAAAEAADAKLAADRAVRLQEMRDSKANQLATMEKQRIQKAKDDEAAAKKAKREAAEAVEVGVREVAQAQAKVRSKFGVL
jgi:hypothetical protein